MSQDQNVYPGMGETNPLHTNVYGPPPSGFGVPPPSYSQAPGGPYPPAAGYFQPGFPSAGAGFAPGPYPQMPFTQGAYPQGPYPQRPYPQGPYPHRPYQGGPVQPGFSGNSSGMTSRLSYPGDGHQMSYVFSVSVWDDKIIRHDFIRKVFMILTSQLLVTFATVAVCTLNENAKKFVQANPWMVYLSFFVNLAVLIVLLCFKDLSRRYPWNLVALSIFTLTYSYMVGMIASFYDTDIVVIAVGITAVVCSAVMVFSLQWLAIDTQMLLGNKQLSLSPDDYIFAVLHLYLDILNIFLFILRIVGYSSN
ncbi:glutamate receptor, ionotropic, N-methyl D-aspartate-associated protein 1a (glutamate binding) isoform X3 [Nelusetta ayraudi]|uniref:glutamate receptor, ionotropic, N-methyl D-aspartate-associated protein 1a (glutamate binding) isoform X3 n=1 Tax=Nelusetta ayraudi TaxID=303726 RepID=UPI003F6F42CD